MEKSKIMLLLKIIKAKKTFAGLSDDFVLKELNRFFIRSPNIQNALVSASEKDFQRLSLFKKTVKEVRKALHKSYGAFQRHAKRDFFLKKLSLSKKPLSEIELHKKILYTSLSTRERLGFYSSLYEDLFLITSKPKSILDLGAGLNPCSFPFMNLKKAEYVATEINSEDKDFLQHYFDIIKEIKGKALLLDLTDIENLKKLPRTDICFIFKLLESLEPAKKKKYYLAESLIKGIKSKWIIASFATKTLGKRKMRFPQRKWFELMMQRLNLLFEKLEYENEIFYVIKNF